MGMTVNELLITDVIRELDLVGLKHRAPTERSVVIEGGIHEPAAVLVRGFREVTYKDISIGKEISPERRFEGRRALLEHVLEKLKKRGAFGFKRGPGEEEDTAEVHSFVLAGTEIKLVFKKQ